MRGSAPNTKLCRANAASARLSSGDCRESLRHVDTPGLALARSHHIEVTTLDEFQPTANSQLAKATGGFTNWSRALGVLGTLLVHGIALNSVGWGSSAHKAPLPETRSAGAMRSQSAVELAEELVLLNLDSTQKGDADLRRLVASLTPRLTDIWIEVVSPEPIPIAATADVGGSSSPEADAGDPTVRALQAGRYRGQISARIERAWIRPRTPVDDSRNLGTASDNDQRDSPFICQVQVRQDPRGNIEEVLLLRCNGTEAWRHSLVVAINQSSPLPAPPIPSVFARDLIMTFQAHAYEPGAPAYEYETQATGGALLSSTLPARSSAQTFDAVSGRPRSLPSGHQGSPNR